MESYRQVIENGEVKIPCIMMVPSNSVGAAVIIHGYGGCKEEQLGLAWRIAEEGLVTCTIDLRGHGQNILPLDEKILSDVGAAIKYCRHFGKVVTIGHSLGGRLSLVSDADYAIGISPALGLVFGNQTREILKNLRKYKVRIFDSEDFLEVFRRIPVWESSKDRPTLIIYGSRDIPEIISACDKINAIDVPTLKIEGAFHNDIFLNELTYEKVIVQLKKWFN